MTLPAITLWQPWASWVAWLWKLNETRTHDRFAGLLGKRIAIHAGKTFDLHAIEMIQRLLIEHHGMRLGDYLMRRLPERRYWPYGCVLCTAMVDEVGWLDPGHEADSLCSAERLYGLVLSDVYQFPEPIPETGHQGIWQWEVPAGVVVEPPSGPSAPSPSTIVARRATP